MNLTFEVVVAAIVLIVTPFIVAYLTSNQVSLRTPKRMIRFFYLRCILYLNTIYTIRSFIPCTSTIFIDSFRENISPFEFLLGIAWLFSLFLTLPFIAAYFVDNTSNNGLISYYKRQRCDGQKIPYKVFKNFYILYPNYVANLDDAFFIKNPETFNPEERFCFGFFDFIKVMLFLARQQEPILEKPNASATLLMQQIIDEDMKQNSAKMRAAAQESIKIINNMER